MVPFKRALVTSYKPCILTRFRDIAGFVLQHATFSHPTSSPCSPGNRWMIFGQQRAKIVVVGLIICIISFKDFQPMWSWSNNVTDRQRDRRTDVMQLH